MLNCRVFATEVLYTDQLSELTKDLVQGLIELYDLAGEKYK